MVVALATGAGAGAALITLSPAWLPVLTLLPVSTVIAAARRFRRSAAASDN